MIAPELDLVVATLRDRGYALREAVAMTGDVSHRRYFRLELEGEPSTAILALYPPALHTAAQRYLRATRLLERAGLRVPAILEVAPRGDWVVTEDLGPSTVFDLRERPFEEIEPYFLDAVRSMARIASLDRGAVSGLNPPLDTALLRRELAMTRRVFFEPRGLELGPAAQSALDALCARLGAERAVGCHRDFGVRNLLPRPGGRIAIVDHQDLRLGPASYDLASLLNDSLFPPPAAEERLLEAAGCTDYEAYHRAAAQRTLKAVGSYAAFADRSPRYLPLVAPTLRRALAHLARVPETATVAPSLAEAWLGHSARLTFDSIRGELPRSAAPREVRR